MDVEVVARMLGCPWTVSGLWLLGHKVQADDGDWVDDDDVDLEVDRKCVCHRPGNQWCQVESALKG